MENESKILDIIEVNPEEVRKIYSRINNLERVMDTIDTFAKTAQDFGKQWLSNRTDEKEKDRNHEMKVMDKQIRLLMIAWGLITFIWLVSFFMGEMKTSEKALTFLFGALAGAGSMSFLNKK
jgi:hypothetical protein